MKSVRFRLCSLAVLGALLVVASGGFAQWIPLNPVVRAVGTPQGARVQMQEGVLHLEAYGPGILRVRFALADTLPVPAFSVVLPSPDASARVAMRDDPDSVLVAAARVSASVAKRDGKITFRDAGGKVLFVDYSRTLTPVEFQGEHLYRAEVFSNLWDSRESFFGLGQHQAGVWNYRGESVELSQDNTNISIPLVVSDRGYGIFWNNTGRTRFNNRFVHALYLSAEAADAVDYFLIAGPSMDSVVAAYRHLTGGVPMFGRWAYGFWQCKNRYKTQSELLGVAREYRTRHIPVDNIVQDWFWWNIMGEPVFDAARYPDPKGMVQQLHQDHFHLMISVWPYFRPGSATYETMDRKGFFIDRTKVEGFHPARMALYDAFNPEARRFYWGLMDTALFRIGADAWWLDTTEPETEGRETNVLVTGKVAGQNGARYANLFPTMTTRAVAEGQRGASKEKRVFILSRSAFAGTQRNGVAVWSGDVNGNWATLQRQIPAGLNYALSGMPYWTTDIGGFTTSNPDDPAYRELFVRWFQFGTFNPIFRVHGTREPDKNELWSYGPEAENILVNFDRLRYRLLPYIYSLAWKTTSAGSTIMRPLVMDFPADPRAVRNGSEFMFGPAFLVAPVTEPQPVSWQVYLPVGAWRDFWTGNTETGGRVVQAAAALDRMPLFVRAGSIVPMGPDVEWAGQRPADTLEVRVYPGADGAFALYEDEGDSYRYEEGAYSVIPMEWNDARRELTIGERKGTYPGMTQARVLRVIVVGPAKGTGVGVAAGADAVVRYHGAKAVVPIP